MSERPPDGEGDGTVSDDEEKDEKLEWRDYLALGIAALETVLLPFVVLMVILIVALLIVR